ncbi:class I glutamine amidotransferase (macronuclear) [Tetrahymena thermophila SB210]|uniref:folate gamma-glutamyl hydrolase n=1 Tax=Tetrahymena thermophila (strain SB210) TaxID=312017 RepID=Q22CN1_TETTS|nr:class I glutamine amidotransferase [Tetrahymena thermophila SB210]EAR83021.1 class I glutamine amidotransferase [Tetrahymena thermophila SB210]|eukprot:XP_001030684.1 class I glutamine amidotransferase [Tetrahymena thermophila SB210]
MKRLLLISLIALTVLAGQYENQYQPVIGVLTQPSNDLNQTLYPADKYSYISSSYVKWLMASGARVVPIPYDSTEEEQDYYLAKVNGLLFPGGDASLWVDEETHTGLSQMTLTGQRLMNKVIELNRNGTYFPLLGTCLGYELISIALTNDDKVLDLLNSTNHVLNTQTYHKQQSLMYSSLNSKQLEAISNQKALYYNHRYGITLDHFRNQTVLNSFFRLTAFAFDNNDTAFVSSLEGKDIPIFGNQFHPEKNSYEWLSSVHANHSPEAINVAQAMGNFIVNQARKNQNYFSQDELEQYNIEAFPLKTVYESFVSVYVFKNKNFTETISAPSNLKNNL